MPLKLAADAVAPLAAGAALCGSGGGGSARLLELMLPRAIAFPAVVRDAAEVDPRTPCFAPAFAGSTMLLGERLPGAAPFSRLLDAAERWLGARIPAACALEGGGLNALVPLLFAEERTVVDADLSGRAVPTLDRLTLFVDRVPGLFAICETGDGGFAVVSSDRGADVDSMMRAAVVQAGGAAAVVLAGFTVGDLGDHAIHGHLSRSLALGEALGRGSAASLERLASEMGAKLLGQGRVLESVASERDRHVHTTELVGPAGEVFRLIARSEFLAFQADGEILAASPDFIVGIDVLSREILEVTDLRPNRHVAVLALPAAPWWRARPERAARIAPSSYGLAELDQR